MSRVKVIASVGLQSEREFDYSSCIRDTTHQSLVFSVEGEDRNHFYRCVISNADLFNILRKHGYLRRDSSEER